MYIINAFDDALLRPHRHYIDSNKVAVVCSARSGSTKVLGTTNLLLRAADEALSSRKKRVSVSGTATPNLGLFGRVKDPSRSSSPPQIGSLPGFHQTVELVRQEHYNAAKENIQDPDIRKELEDEIDADCEWLASFLSASQVGLLFANFRAIVLIECRL